LSIRKASQKKKNLMSMIQVLWSFMIAIQWLFMKKKNKRLILSLQIII